MNFGLELVAILAAHGRHAAGAADAVVPDQTSQSSAGERFIPMTTAARSVGAPALPAAEALKNLRKELTDVAATA